jgi:hypothetical protein
MPGHCNYMYNSAYVAITYRYCFQVFLNAPVLLYVAKNYPPF